MVAKRRREKEGWQRWRRRQAKGQKDDKKKPLKIFIPQKEKPKEVAQPVKGEELNQLLKLKSNSESLLNGLDVTSNLKNNYKILKKQNVAEEKVYDIYEYKNRLLMIIH